jgi:prephenate dehydratase
VLGYLGPQGTHSESVALYWQKNFGKGYELKAYSSIYEAMQAVQSGEVERCAVPVENSIEGSINITLDTLAHELDLQVELEIDWAVHNNLLAVSPADEIRVILSHPQPIAQCHHFLQERYPQAELRQLSSTAKAAEIAAAEGAGYAAIACTRAAELYGLKVVEAEIQDNKNNCTRFFVLKKKSSNLMCGKDKTSLICQIDGAKAGSLCEVLLELSKRNVNLTRIESRPARTGLGHYIFFLCIDASIEEKNVSEALAAVAKKSLWIKNLGSFSVVTRDYKK